MKDRGSPQVAIPTMSWDLWLIIFVACAVHLLGIHRPLLGNFSMYQTANAMMARGFIENGFTDILCPQIHVLVNGQPGLLLLAYPLSALLAAIFQFFFGGNLDFWGRFQAVLFFAGSCLYLYRLIAYLTDLKTARTSLVAFILFPLTLIYGQSFQNEMLTVFFSLTTLYYAIRAMDHASLFRILTTALSFSMVLITRPNLATLGLPMVIYLLQKSANPQPSLPARLKSFALILIATLPIPLLWYWHIWHTSHEASNIYSTLFAQLEVRSSFASPVIFQADYYQKLVDVLAGMVLTPVGLGLWLLGVLRFRPARNHLFFYAWMLSFAVTGLLMPRKLLEHEFYWLHFLPAAAPFIATTFLSVTQTETNSNALMKFRVSLLIVLTTALSLRYSLHPSFKTSEEDRHLIEIAAQVSKQTEKHSSRLLVQGSHPVLYYADRYGWPLSLKTYEQAPDYYLHTNWEKLPEAQRLERNQAIKNPISNLEYHRKVEGATHLLILNPQDFYSHREFSDYILGHYPAVSQEEGIYLLFDLRNEAIPPAKP